MDSRADIQITKLDNTHLRIDAEDSIKRELSDYFTFPVPGAKFMPSVRNKYWDGNIRLYAQHTGKLYVGLYYALQQFAKDREYSIEGQHWETDVEIENFTDNLNMGFELRDYQVDAISRAIKNRRQLLVSPTASGKSAIIYCIARHFLKIHKKKVLIIVPTTSLVEQMSKDFEEYGYPYPIDKMYGGDKVGNTKIVISTWQTLSRMPKSFFDDFGAVFGDEAHLFKAKVLTGILEKLKHIGHRWGLTGTLDDTQTHKLVLEGLFGPTHYVTTSADLMDEGVLAELDIQCLVLKYPPEVSKEVVQMDYPREMEFLADNERRTQFIKNLTLDKKGNTLILFQYVDKHGRKIFDAFQKAGIKSFFIYGGTDTKNREQVRELMERESGCVIIASYGTFSTGINIKNLHNIIFASPSKSKIRVLQSIGRVLRTSKDKFSATLFDIADDLSYKNRDNYTLRHFKERINTYSKERFKYTIHEVKF
tara:strand:- start:1627 stop:3060 length:1434 start_codon:yes stop_codon:yes gene_type:complete